MHEEMKGKTVVPKACSSLSIKEKSFMIFLVTYITSKGQNYMALYKCLSFVVHESSPSFTCDLWEFSNQHIQMIEAKGENEIVELPPHKSKLPDSILFLNMTLSNNKLSAEACRLYSSML
jgi:hypothetical protein